MKVQKARRDRERQRHRYKEETERALHVRITCFEYRQEDKISMSWGIHNHYLFLPSQINTLTKTHIHNIMIYYGRPMLVKIPGQSTCRSHCSQGFSLAGICPPHGALRRLTLHLHIAPPRLHFRPHSLFDDIPSSIDCGDGHILFSA